MTRIFRSVAAVACVAVLWIVDAKAQSLGIDLGEKYVDTILAKGEFSAAGQDVTIYTVPAKRFFRLTDLYVTNTTSQACDYRVFVGAGETNEFTAQPRSTFALNFTTGLLFKGPTTVTIRNTPRLGGPTGCGLVTVTGILTQKAKKSQDVAAEEE